MGQNQGSRSDKVQIVENTDENIQEQIVISSQVAPTAPKGTSRPKCKAQEPNRPKEVKALFIRTAKSPAASS